MRPQTLYFLFSEVACLKGVGPAMRKALTRLLHRVSPEDNDTLTPPVVRDLLFHMPVGLIDRRFSPPLNDVPDGSIITTVVTIGAHTPGRGKRPYKIYAYNDTGDMQLVFFSSRPDYLKASLPEGQMRAISGKAERFDGILQMTHPDRIAPVAQIEQVKRVEPVYPLTAGISNHQIGKFIHAALAQAPDLPEWIDASYLKQKDWKPWKAALIEAHEPHLARDLERSHPARQRLAYDELLASQLVLAILRQRMQKHHGLKILPQGNLRNALLEALPFTLTRAQQRVIKEIDTDLASSNRMLRLLQGDVGSGKTAVALAAMLAAVEAGYQAALMVPTEILGHQHIRFITPLAEKIGVKAAFLSGNVKGKEREEIMAGLESGEIGILVGTHALIQEKVTFNNLALAVIDEQHRFGVNQRMKLNAKAKASSGFMPHILLMTATPIPRSLSMSYYGDMDASVLDEKPANRKKIETRTIALERMEEVVEGLKRAISQGNRVYWICPLIEQVFEDFTPQNDLAAAEERFEGFQKIFGDRVGLAHGRMKPNERANVMEKFRSGEIDVLVATTVVEVGVDVPDATVMVIEHAERFGLAQLHQLRGRVGRSDKPSTCILLYGSKLGEVAKERLKIMRASDDGFAIAEEDLRLRGGGDLLGTRQSGLPDFYFADLYAHRDLLATARDDAKLILHRDPTLTGPRGAALKTLLYLFSHDANIRFLGSG